MKRSPFEITFDRAFDEVIQGCASVRLERGEGTWLVPEMIEAYKTLHRLGVAHSAEAWLEGKVVGGLYGVTLGQVFFGESMFTRRPEASKCAFVTLVGALERWGFSLIDCQLHTHHLERFGARYISREAYLSLLSSLVQRETSAPSDWSRERAANGAADKVRSETDSI